MFSGCAVIGNLRPAPAKPAQPVAMVQPVAPAPRPTPKPKTESPEAEIAKYAEKCKLTIYSPEMYDSLLVDWHERNVIKSHDDFFTQFIEIDTSRPVVGEVPDSVYEARLRRLVSPVNLGYNDIVKNYIVSWTTRNKGTVSRILGLSQVYFPMIEEELARQGLPLELRMLPVIESALNPTAVSRAGATGLWQFMLATGRSYGLEVTSMVDDRRDPVMATRAAASHLRDLYRMYGDWTIAIAAYNCGEGNVNKAIARAGGQAQTFWDIYPYLPRETRGYLPSFVAANYAYAYHKQHGIEMTEPPLPLCTDTVTVNKLTHFEQISTTLDIPVEALRALNPQYKEDIIPAVERTYALKLPQPDVTRYLAREDEIHAKDSLYLAKYLAQPKAALAPVPSSSVHTVKKGEVLGTIARKYGVTVSQIVKWNKLRSANSIRPGQRLEILK
jgi:membrane-bound lytic murein transglycosylase D